MLCVVDHLNAAAFVVVVVVVAVVVVVVVVVAVVVVVVVVVVAVLSWTNWLLLCSPLTATAGNGKGNSSQWFF